MTGKKTPYLVTKGIEIGFGAFSVGFILMRRRREYSVCLSSKSAEASEGEGFNLGRSSLHLMEYLINLPGPLVFDISMHFNKDVTHIFHMQNKSKWSMYGVFLSSKNCW